MLRLTSLSSKRKKVLGTLISIAVLATAGYLTLSPILNKQTLNPIIVRKVPGSWQLPEVQREGFVPETVNIVIGVNNTIIWLNEDSKPHTAHSDTPEFDSGVLPPGQRFIHAFMRRGIFTYHCDFHPWRRGTVIVKGLSQAASHILVIGEPAHISGGITRIVGDYRIQFDTYPSPPTPRTNTMLIFSIQDTYYGGNRENVTTSVAILKDGNILIEFPKELHRYGDFTYQVIFPVTGSYTIILTIFEGQKTFTAELNITLYDQLVVWILTVAPLLPLGFSLAVIGFLYLRNRSKTTSTQEEN